MWLRTPRPGELRAEQGRAGAAASPLLRGQGSPARRGAECHGGLGAAEALPPEPGPRNSGPEVRGWLRGASLSGVGGSLRGADEAVSSSHGGL